MSDESRPLVKVCGLTDPGTARVAAHLGADWIGLNFHPPSPRSIPIGAAPPIIEAIAGLAEPVGLFVDRPPAEVAEFVARLGLRTIQLHGDRSPADLATLAASLPPGVRIVLAFRLADRDAIARMMAYLAEAAGLGEAPHAILVDAHVEGQAGGTGRSIPAELLSELPGHPRLILAGGLTPENVAERVATVRPWMVDVASGVESSPGVKDVERIRRFIAEARCGSATA